MRGVPAQTSTASGAGVEGASGKTDREELADKIQLQERAAEVEEHIREVAERMEYILRERQFRQRLVGLLKVFKRNQRTIRGFLRLYKERFSTRTGYLRRRYCGNCSYCYSGPKPRS